MNELCETAYNRVRDAQAVIGMVRSVTFDLYQQNAGPNVDISSSRKLSELDSAVRVAYDLLEQGLDALGELECAVRDVCR